MAYKSKETNDTIIADIQKNNRGDYIRVTRIEGKDDYSVDVRNMYTNNDGEICFTQKGVRMNSENVVEVVVAMLKALNDEDFESVLNAFSNDDEDSNEDADEDADKDE